MIYLTEEKNVHMEHIEDLILDNWVGVEFHNSYKLEKCIDAKITSISV